MTKLKEVLARAERLVTPGPRDVARLESTAEKVMIRVRDAASAFSEVTEVMVGGSFAKGTWLPGDVDIDLFVKISPSTSEARFEFVGLAVGREAVRGYPHGKKFAQHPYTEATIDGVKVNVVPCYDVKLGEWKSAADRSPYHVEFVTKHMNSRKKTEVRLLKRFMKAVGVYGAEIENEGFSGYAAEALVYSHGSLEGVLTYFAGLKPKEESFLTLKDPIDGERELARAISKESVARMMLASRAFLAAPEERYFGKLNPVVRRGLERRLYGISFDHRALSEDTLWGELKKTTRQVVKYVEGKGFTISRAISCSNDSDRSAILLLPETESLSTLEERVGPGLELDPEVRKFVAKNRDAAELIWVGDDGRLHLLQRRETTELATLLAGILSDPSQVGGSKEMVKAIRRNGRLLNGEGLRRESSKEGWLREGVERIVTDSIGTDRIG